MAAIGVHLGATCACAAVYKVRAGGRSGGSAWVSVPPAAPLGGEAPPTGSRLGLPLSLFPGWPRRCGRQRCRGPGHSRGGGVLGERGGEAAPPRGAVGRGALSAAQLFISCFPFFFVQVVGLAAKQSRIRNISNTVVKVKQILGRR